MLSQPAEASQCAARRRRDWGLRRRCRDSATPPEAASDASGCLSRDPCLDWACSLPVGCNEDGLKPKRTWPKMALIRNSQFRKLRLFGYSISDCVGDGYPFSKLAPKCGCPGCARNLDPKSFPQLWPICGPLLGCGWNMQQTVGADCQSLFRIPRNSEPIASSQQSVVADLSMQTLAGGQNALSVAGNLGLILGGSFLDSCTFGPGGSFSSTGYVVGCFLMWWGFPALGLETQPGRGVVQGVHTCGEL